MIILLPSRIEYMPDAEHNDVYDLGAETDRGKSANMADETR